MHQLIAQVACPEHTHVHGKQNTHIHWHLRPTGMTKNHTETMMAFSLGTIIVEQRTTPATLDSRRCDAQKAMCCTRLRPR